MTDISLRSPELVMRPAWMGAVRLTRYSFGRMLIRRAFRDRWRIGLGSVDLDAEGRGEVRFDIEIGKHRFTFVAFTTTLDESEHTDRVIADRWEITAALCEGVVDAAFLTELRANVPRQEQGRLDSRVLVLTRGNRSVRFFDYLVNTLASGQQPDPTIVGDAGYIMRSTAFYGNGAFGMRAFADYDAGHPVAAPFRAQFLAAWLFRELSYVVVEHCAHTRGGESAVGFDTEWSRFFGLGNATGLGLVPYAFKHPAVIDAWVRLRERSLAEVRAYPGDAHLLERLDWWIARAAAHFASGTGDDCTPFLNGADLVGVIDAIADALEHVRDEPLPFDALYRWAEAQDPETAELVVSLLIELHGADAVDGADPDDGIQQSDRIDRENDREVDSLLVVDEHSILDPATTIAEVRRRIAGWYPWLDSLPSSDNSADRDRPDRASDESNVGRSDWYWWLITDNTNEPRRAPRAKLDPDGRDVPVDIALRLLRLRDALDGRPDDEPIHRLLTEHPEHRYVADRLARRFTYGEPIDNACDRSYMPLMVQRFQLAMYGMDNFKPKSTDWLRVTLFQGAPRIADLNQSATPTTASPPGPPSAPAPSRPAPFEMTDGWVWPPRPGPNHQPGETHPDRAEEAAT